MDKNIESLLKELGSMSYTPPSSYKGYQSGLPSTGIGYKNIGVTPSKFTVDDFQPLGKSGKSKKVLTTIGDVLNGTLGQIGGMMTDSAYHTVKDLKDPHKSAGEKLLDVLFKDSVGGSIVRGIGNGGKEQWKDWTDGDFSWGNVPGIGFLHGMEKGFKRGDDVLDAFGMKDGVGRTIAGIGIDILADPLTYFTGGLSTASKLSKVAEVQKIAELAKGMDVTGKFRNTSEFLIAAENKLRTKYPNLSDRLISKKLEKLTEHIKTAKNSVFNENINKWGMSIPFSNKLTMKGGNISEKVLGMTNPLYRSEAKLGDKYAHVIDGLLNHASSEDAALKDVLTQVVKKRYGVDNVTDLTKTQFDDLSSKIEPLKDLLSKTKGLPDAETKWKADFGGTPDLSSSIDNLLSDMDKAPSPRTPNPFNNPDDVKIPKITSPRLPKDAEMKWDTTTDVFKQGKPETVANKYASGVNKTIDNLLDNPYNEMNNAKTAFEHLLDKVNPFDARTLKTGDKFLDSMANHIADGNSQRIGETNMFTKQMSKLQSLVKKQGYTPDEMTQAIYVLEKHAPQHLGGSKWKPSARVQELANHIKPIIDNITENERGSVLDNLRKNYFPHVVNQSSEKMKELADVIKRHPELNGLKSASKFNQSRKGFQTLAERDNFLHDIAKAISKETDPDKLEALQKAQDEIANLFDTDVVSALQRRIKEGVRAKAMKAMQGELSKFGMMKSLAKDAPDDLNPPGLQRIDKDVAKKLGLGEGKHFIHPEVLKGMERVDEIFTNEGMNKFVRHLSAISDIWRPLVTYYKPSHYRNNMIGNTIINMAAGVTVSDYKAARKLLKAYRSGKVTDQQMKIIKAAYKHNVMSGGFLFDSKATFQFDDPKALEKLAEKIGNNKVIKKVKNGGEVVDDYFRLANFINGIHKYGKTEKAAAQVREYLFNYNELTNADRSMRVVVPFWNWTKRNVPLQMKLLMENPKFAMNNERFKELFNKDQEGADWQKESGIKIPGMDYYTSIPSPTTDLDLLLHPTQFLGSLNPALKVPTELATNHKLYTGKPISYGSDSVQGKDLFPYLMSNMGVGNNAYQMFNTNDNKSIGESIMNLFNPMTKISPVGR